MRLLESAELRKFDANGHGAGVAYVRDCIDALGTKAIRNVRTEMQVLDTGRHTFPVSVNTGDERPENSYVVSPLTAYSGYARDELERNDVGWFAPPLRFLTDVSGAWLSAARIDRLVQVNNWLLSTNIYPPDWSGDDLEPITSLLDRALAGSRHRVPLAQRIQQSATVGAYAEGRISRAPQPAGVYLRRPRRFRLAVPHAAQRPDRRASVAARGVSHRSRSGEDRRGFRAARGALQFAVSRRSIAVSTRSLRRRGCGAANATVGSSSRRLGTTKGAPTEWSGGL